MTKIATRRSEMTPGARQALNELDACLAKMLTCHNDGLPERFRSGRDDEVSFLTLIKKTTPKVVHVDPLSVSVKFNSDRSIAEATPERLARLEKYRAQAESESITYDEVNDMGEYNALVEFACEMAKLGVFTEDDFEDEE